MILESCQAISKASNFVFGDDLRDSAVATVMFKLGVVSYEPVARLCVCYSAACYCYGFVFMFSMFMYSYSNFYADFEFVFLF